MSFLLRITRFGAEGFGVICGGFAIIPILLDFLENGLLISALLV